MAGSIQEILRPQVLTKVVSRQMSASHWILNFMGFTPGGRNEVNMGHGRNGTYNVYNRTRKVGLGRAPATAAARASRQGVGKVPFIYPRMHESVGLPAEEVHNIGQIADPAMRDIAGQDMIMRQTRTEAEKAANWRAVQTIGMLRDTLYAFEQGDDWYFTFTSSSSLFQVSSAMPSGNKSQLDMLGGGDIIDTSWDNPSADIPRHLGEIDAAFQQLYGGRLDNMIVTNSLWQHIIKNDHVSSQAGIANAPFTQFERTVGTREDGTPFNEQVGKLACRPMLNIWITDEGLDLGAPGSESFTKYVEDTGAIFMPDPMTPDIYSMHVGSEPIAEYDGGPETVRTGLSSWSVKRSNPTETELFILDNCLAINHIPNSTAYGTVVF